MSTAIASDLLTRVEAAEYLRIKPQTLAAWATNRHYFLPTIHVGRTVRIVGVTWTNSSSRAPGAASSRTPPNPQKRQRPAVFSREASRRR